MYVPMYMRGRYKVEWYIRMYTHVYERYMYIYMRDMYVCTCNQQLIQLFNTRNTLTHSEHRRKRGKYISISLIQTFN